MKLGPVTKLEKRNTTTSKQLTMASCQKITIYDQLGAIQEPDSGRMVCNSYIFINSNLLSYKT